MALVRWHIVTTVFSRWSISPCSCLFNNNLYFLLILTDRDLFSSNVESNIDRTRFLQWSCTLTLHVIDKFIRKWFSLFQVIHSFSLFSDVKFEKISITALPKHFRVKFLRSILVFCRYLLEPFWNTVLPY